MKRTSKTLLVGSVVAMVGLILFLSSNAISSSANSIYVGGTNGEHIDAEARDRDIPLWCALGFTFVLSGASIATAALYAWCRNEEAVQKQNPDAV